MGLYEIDRAILECVDEETGEVIDMDKLENLSMERDAKIEGICLYIKNLKAQAKALKEEEDSFSARRKTAENKMESLKKYIADYLAGTPFESAKVKVSYRKSESLEVSDGAVIPGEYLKIKEPEVKKTELKKALKEGLKIDGVSIVEKQNLQIK